ncbi:MAG TPA: hypothetical protein VIL86_02155 [Tepidisphaeraceae bacterium]|jgi:hypothetical protein
MTASLDPEAVAKRVKAACGELGFDSTGAQRMVSEVLAPEFARAKEQITALTEENARLRADLQALQAAQAIWMGKEAEIAMLLKSTNPQKIVHDLRNVLNELALLNSVLDSEEEASK